MNKPTQADIDAHRERGRAAADAVPTDGLYTARLRGSAYTERIVERIGRLKNCDGCGHDAEDTQRVPDDLDPESHYQWCPACRITKPYVREAADAAGEEK